MIGYGAVDLQDFGILKAHFGESGGWGEGDFNSDRLVDLQDFALLKDNFGESLPLSSVPGPATLSLVALGTISLWRRRGRVR